MEMTSEDAFASHGTTGREGTKQQEQNSGAKKKCKMIFVHLDLGIGGAEQLVLNLALASLPRSAPGHDDGNNPSRVGVHADVTIYTSHMSPTHCFDQFKRPDGKLCDAVSVCGSFLPVTVLGYGTAFCSTIRMLYITYCAVRSCPDADLFVLDVLPTSIPFLVEWWSAKAVLFYCHFPDKLLTRDTVNGVAINPTSNGRRGGNDDTEGLTRFARVILGFARGLYRGALDALEEYTMRYADLIAVNSNFTRGEVSRVFPSLASSNHRTSSSFSDEEYIQVLYPPIDLTNFIRPNFIEKQKSMDKPIVSLNRFERKKNVGLLLEAYSILQKEAEEMSESLMPELVIAGGYDPRNVENIEYLSELKCLSQRLGIPSQKVSFRPSVSDDERANLLRNALCVVYTPHREHFGIVPLEAMYAGSPVVAVRSGGPVETVVHDVTGFLCDNNPESFANALQILVQDERKALEMGKKGHEHVASKFGLETFRKDWERIVNCTIERGHRRREMGLKRGIFPRWVGYLLETFVALVFAVVLTMVLKRMGVLGPRGTVWGAARDAMLGRRDIEL